MLRKWLQTPATVPDENAPPANVDLPLNRTQKPAEKRNVYGTTVSVSAQPSSTTEETGTKDGMKRKADLEEEQEQPEEADQEKTTASVPVEVIKRVKVEAAVTAKSTSTSNTSEVDSQELHAGSLGESWSEALQKEFQKSYYKSVSRAGD